MRKRIINLANPLTVLVVLAAGAAAACGETARLEMPQPTPTEKPVDHPAPDAAIRADDAAMMMHNDAPDAGSIAAPDAAPSEMSAPDAGGSSGNAIDLNGIWGAKLMTSQIVRVPLSGNATETLTALARVEVAFANGNAMLTVKTCKIDLAPISGLTTVYPQAAIDSMMPGHATASLGEVHVGTHYASAPYTGFLGWTPQMSPTEGLPTDPNDRRVVDQDNDGHPGVTLRTTGAINSDVYVVNRTTIALDGTVTSADRVEGNVTADSAQVILDATSILIPRGALSATPDPEPAHNTFVLVRIAGGADQCSDIIANAGSLFP